MEHTIDERVEQEKKDCYTDLLWEVRELYIGRTDEEATEELAKYCKKERVYK